MCIGTIFFKEEKDDFSMELAKSDPIAWLSALNQGAPLFTSTV